MRFDLSDDDRALQAGIRDLCRSDAAPDHPKARAAPGGVDRKNWRTLGESGIFSLRLAEDRGGVGLGATQAILVFEELGRANVPGPLVGSHLAAHDVDGAAEGERIVGVIERPPGQTVIEHLGALDVLVALDEEGLWAIEPDELSDAEPVVSPLDPLTPIHRYDALPQGEGIGGPAEAARWRREGAALTAALCVGLSVAATDAAVAYAKDRHQFGRPIGSFQAVKHLCADMLVRAEIARAAAHAAGATMDDPEAGDVERAVAAAKLLASEAAFRNGKDCIQVHGGMGFTWEQNVHLYLKRAAVLATHFGDAGAHAETVAASL